MDTLQKTRKISRKNQPVARCISRKKREKKKRSAPKHSHDFLRQPFAPVTALNIPPRPVIKQMESRFISSIRNLSRLYGFKARTRTEKKYPFSIMEWYNHAVGEMQKRSASVELVILQENDEFPVIATVKEIDTGLTLYYVPLDALWQLHLKRKKDAFRLLLSLYAYLYHIACMPLLNHHCYMKGNYDMMKQSYEENEDEFDEQEFRQIMHEFGAIDRISPILNNEIANTGNLYDLPFRIESFVSTDFFDFSLLSVARKFLALWRQFPNESFASTNAAEFLHPEEEERVYSEQFFSFCWAFDGWMMDQLLEWVNCELQEKSVFELPFSIQKFDVEHNEIIHDFSYQKQLLDLLNELSDTLNELYE